MHNFFSTNLIILFERKMDSSFYSEEDVYVYIDINVDHAIEKYMRAEAFVEANNIKYNFSSKSIKALGGRELKSVLDMYNSDYEWNANPSIVINNSHTSHSLTPGYATINEIVIKPQPYTRMIIKCYQKECPLTCENFIGLITHKYGSSKSASNIPLHYKSCKFHRLLKNFILQGGDIIMQNGSGGESIWNKKFKDEKNGLKMKHNRRGLLSMCNSGKNSNSSQFFITLSKQPTPQLDGKHVIFGEIVSGIEVLDLLENIETVGDGVPQQNLNIYACGLWNKGDPVQGYYQLNGFCAVNPICATDASAIDTPNPDASHDTTREHFDKKVCLFALKEDQLLKMKQICQQLEIVPVCETISIALLLENLKKMVVDKRPPRQSLIVFVLQSIPIESVTYQDLTSFISENNQNGSKQNIKLVHCKLKDISNFL